MSVDNLCCVCFERQASSMLQKCSHSTCTPCIMKIQNKENDTFKCPLCRQISSKIYEKYLCNVCLRSLEEICLLCEALNETDCNITTLTACKHSFHTHCYERMLNRCFLCL